MFSLLSVTVLDFHLIQISIKLHNTRAMVWNYWYTNSCLFLLVTTNKPTHSHENKMDSLSMHSITATLNFFPNQVSMLQLTYFIGQNRVLWGWYNEMSISSWSTEKEICQLQLIQRCIILVLATLMKLNNVSIHWDCFGSGRSTSCLSREACSSAKGKSWFTKPGKTHEEVTQWSGN